jgi:hypothetical protein
MRQRCEEGDDAMATQSPIAGQTDYRFERGFPTREATQQARDDADYQRALTAYRFWYPTVSIEGFFHGARLAGGHDNQKLFILSATPRFLCFTPNSDTPYCGGAIDLSNGPMVIELAPGPFIAAADTHHQGWILDMGLPGPDAGQGGKHLLLPPGYDGEVPDGYQRRPIIDVQGLPRHAESPARRRHGQGHGRHQIDQGLSPCTGVYTARVRRHYRDRCRCHASGLGGQPRVLAEAARGD